MTTLPPTAMGVPPMPPSLAARYPSLPGDASWTALLAETSQGLGGLERWRVKVQQDARAGDTEVRQLVVQAYLRSDVKDGYPTDYARPLASTQRAVSSDELTRGVVVELLHFAEPGADSVVLAWTEAAVVDLDLDGLETRPTPSSRFAHTVPLNARD